MQNVLCYCFLKGLILVEGDAEEIMLPSMVKKTLGVSLDELGIGVINIGSVSLNMLLAYLRKNVCGGGVLSSQI